MFYLFILVPLIALSFAAQQYVDYVFYKWNAIENAARLTGMQAAERISNDARLGVKLGTINKKLGDHYDPTSHTVRLSTQVATQPSVAALAIVAHELGHAQQKQEDSAMIRLREVLVPAVRLAPTISYLLIIAGVGLERLSLIWMGIACFALTTLFMLMTLPIEIDASRRAFALLEKSHLLTGADRKGARQMLTAAALTYAVTSVFSVVQLVRYILVRR